MRGGIGWTLALATALAAVGLAAPAHAAPAPALTATVSPGALLTLPATDHFRDTVRVAVTGPRGWSVDVLAVGRHASVVLRTGVRLLDTADGRAAANVSVSDRHLHRGTWTIRVRRSGHPRTAADAARHLHVGSGVARTVEVVPTPRTLFPHRDGHLDAVTATVTARDETGAIVPAHGELRLTAGTHRRSVPLRSGVVPAAVRLSVAGLPVGTAMLLASVSGPTGPAATGRAGLHLAATAVTRVTVLPSATTVEPVVDGLADTLSIRVAGSTSIGTAVPVTGRLALTRDGVTVLTWALPTSAARTIVWDGRIGGAIQAGTYRFVVSMRGPEGTTRTATSEAVAVSTEHLPYRIATRFPVQNGNQQGLAVSGGHVYVSTDVGGGQARIDEYDETGALQATIGPLPLGHAAELAVDDRTGLLYVANGGPATPTKVFVVDPAAGTVVRTYDLDALGPNGMVAFDQQAEEMLVFAGTEGSYTITPVALDGTVGASVPVPDEGTPQGLELVHGEVWLYTSLAGAGNRITRLEAGTGAVLDTIELAMTGEGEGLAYDATTDTVLVGAHSTNRVGELEAVTGP